ncbi:unnamed protein product [Pleuronectes platessa]|uniref:Uncharacterized protein n=1 Tax=Pleuronectes platessa TaxID=8262 RepID=A0A9N7U5K3_PLEPL|nr:unnamed protein product [Pleuronectes platessa]
MNNLDGELLTWTLRKQPRTLRRSSAPSPEVNAFVCSRCFSMTERVCVYALHCVLCLFIRCESVDPWQRLWRLTAGTSPSSAETRRVTCETSCRVIHTLCTRGRKPNPIPELLME